MPRTRFALCGLSDRGISLLAAPLIGNPLFTTAEEDLSQHGELVAVLDVDTARIARFAELTGAAFAAYGADEFDRMVAETRPDVIISAGPDATHARYAIAALRHGLKVIVEKPLASTAADARAILDAEAASSGSVVVGHNSRYAAAIGRVRDVVSSGAIGRVVSLDLTWGVDTFHGASYFRRWNRMREMSGGLSVHKSCHHLDMVNWIIGDAAESVYALGGRDFYGAGSPHAPAGADRGSNPYEQRWSDGRLPVEQDHFAGPWQAMGYGVQYPASIRRSIFDEEIDIEDNYSAVIGFAGGARMTYSLSFSSPWEGYRLAINGTHGRLETESVHYRDSVEPEQPQRILVDKLFEDPETISVPVETGAHGGSDARIRRDLVLGVGTEGDPARSATSMQGAFAVAAGEAIWRSVVERRVVSVPELLGFDRMPGWNAVAKGLLASAHVPEPAAESTTT